MIPSKTSARTVQTSDDPEITAMSDIAAILQQLPDDDARMRVMRWAFGRFSTEFKRPAQVPPTVAAPAAAHPTVASSEPSAPEETARPAAAVPSDFGEQISELSDLFPARVAEEGDEDDAADVWPA